ncbi:ABC transporter permease [Desulfosediminicola flagellatus]|uniref:ABC transporter permease n=1 Tax=Desulfosediminicola flagellatus TaxID=2569541 RepID=UPI0010ABDD61|nr:ABC transporter permease [Desulfosediminicola flagellatus]
MNKLASMITKRIVFGVLTLFAISLLIFVGVEALPGDLAEAILGQNATPETIQAFRTELNLDLPGHVRYFTWINNFIHGELGNSLANGRPIAEVIGWRFANSLLLAGTTALFAIPFAIFLGLLAAIYRDSWFDKFISITTLSAISLPEFFVAYILIALLSVQAMLFPSISNINDQMSVFQKMHAIFLPCLTLAFVVVGHMMRMTRAAIINVLSSPFIEMAQLKGINRRRIIIKHALPNALSPIINVVVLNLAYLVVGVVVVEVVFVYPGLGQLLVDAVSKRDLPVVQASGLIFAGTYVFLNLTADVLSMLSNPKLRNPR